MTLPTWLRRHLETQGLMDADGLTRRVRARRCPTCHTHLLAGLDADLAAESVYVDPTPLTPKGEAAAHILGRQTYALRHLGGRLELDRRDQWSITGSPAGSPKATRFDVIATHVCHSGPLPSRPSVHQPAAASRHNGPPPY